VSGALFNSVPYAYDVVHINAEFFDQVSDHDPQVVRLTLLPSAANVTAQIGRDAGGFTRIPGTSAFTQQVTLKNTGTGTISGPISLALDGLTPGTATLTNGSGLRMPPFRRAAPYSGDDRRSRAETPASRWCCVSRTRHWQRSTILRVSWRARQSLNHQTRSGRRNVTTA